MIICTSCGKENVDDGKFCTSCGAKLPEAEEIKPEITLDDAASDILGGETVSESLNESVNDAEKAVTQAASDMEDTVDNAFEQMKGDTASGADSNTKSSYYDAGSYSSSDIYDENQGGKMGFAIGALVCGCLSILCCVCGCCGFPFPVAAIVLGIVCLMKSYDGRGFAIAGLITGGIGLLLQIIMTVAIAASDSGFFNNF